MRILLTDDVKRIYMNKQTDKVVTTLGDEISSNRTCCKVWPNTKVKLIRAYGGCLGTKSR